jgi:hypothetical protein
VQWSIFNFLLVERLKDFLKYLWLYNITKYIYIRLRYELVIILFYYLYKHKLLGIYNYMIKIYVFLCTFVVNNLWLLNIFFLGWSTCGRCSEGEVSYFSRIFFLVIHRLLMNIYLSIFKSVWQVLHPIQALLLSHINIIWS